MHRDNDSMEGLLDDEKGLLSREAAPRPWINFQNVILSITCLCAMTTLGILVLRQPTPDHRVVSTNKVQAGSRVATCGSSIAEATAKGCVWDLMNYAYVPTACYDKEESSRWIEKYGPWKWHRDANGAEPVQQVDLSKTETVYAEQSWHVEHCLYTIRSTHVAGVKNGYVTDQAVQVNHTNHCIDFITRHVSGGGQASTKAELQFMSCVTLDYVSDIQL